MLTCSKTCQKKRQDRQLQVSAGLSIGANFGKVLLLCRCHTVLLLEVLDETFIDEVMCMKNTIESRLGLAYSDSVYARDIGTRYYIPPMCPLAVGNPAAQVATAVQQE